MSFANATVAPRNQNVARSASWVALVTPSDVNALPQVATYGLPLGISFVTAGALHILDEVGNNVTIPSGALAAGIIHPVRMSQIFATGTTALGIVIYG